MVHQTSPEESASAGLTAGIFRMMSFLFTAINHWKHSATQDTYLFIDFFYQVTCWATFILEKDGSRNNNNSQDEEDEEDDIDTKT